MTEEQTNFLTALAPAVQALAARTGLPASVILAQAILESDWGRSALARDHRNYFGIKAPKSRPVRSNAARYLTTEFAGGRPRRQLARFAHFGSIEDCLNEYARILSLPRYARARGVAANPFAFAVELQRGGYATDPRYARKLALLMRRYHLSDYDLPAPALKSEISNLKSPLTVSLSRKENAS